MSGVRSASLVLSLWHANLSLLPFRELRVKHQLTECEIGIGRGPLVPDQQMGHSNPTRNRPSRKITLASTITRSRFSAIAWIALGRLNRCQFTAGKDGYCGWETWKAFPGIRKQQYLLFLIMV